jgi:hypothetical protein
MYDFRGNSSPGIWNYVRSPIVLVSVAAVAAIAVVQVSPDSRTSAVEISDYSRAPRNCTEARAMGLENIPKGSPYYAPWLDADNDGLACEPWRGRRR